MSASMPLPPRRRRRPARAMLGAHARRAHARRRREDGTLSRPLPSFRAFLRPCQCAWTPAARSHLVRDHRHGRPADVPRADAHDVHLGGLRGRRHHHHHAPATPRGALRPASSQPPLSAGLPLPPAPRVRAVWWRRGGDPPQLPHPARARASVAPCAAVSAPARASARADARHRAGGDPRTGVGVVHSHAQHPKGRWRASKLEASAATSHNTTPAACLASALSSGVHARRKNALTAEKVPATNSRPTEGSNARDTRLSASNNVGSVPRNRIRGARGRPPVPGTHSAERAPDHFRSRAVACALASARACASVFGRWRARAPAH